MATLESRAKNGREVDEMTKERKEWLIYAHTHTEAYKRGGSGHILLTPAILPVVGYGAQNMVTVQSGTRWHRWKVGQRTEET
jgi:hypothetical protein